MGEASNLSLLGTIADVLGIQISDFTLHAGPPPGGPTSTDPPSRLEMLSRLNRAFRAMPTDADCYRALLVVETLARAGTTTEQ